MMKNKFLTALIVFILFSFFCLIYYLFFESKYYNSLERGESALAADVESPIYTCQIDNVSLEKSIALKIYNLINSEMLDIQRQGLPEDHIDFLAHVSGVGVPDARAMRNGYSTPLTLPPFSIEDSVLASIKSEQIVNKFISTGDIDLLQESLRSGVVKDEEFYTGKGQMMYLHSKVLSSALDPDVYVRKLIELGVTPKLSDLVLATQYGIDVKLIEYMYNHSTFNAEDKFLYLGTYQSLTTQALFGGHYNQAIYWMEKGSPIEPDRMFINALDIMAISHKMFTKKEFTDISNLLIEKGLKPNWESSYKQLHTSNPDAKISFEQNFSLSSSAVQSIKPILLNFYEKTLDPIKSKIEKYKSTPDCINKVYNKYITLTMNMVRQLNSLEQSSRINRNEALKQDSASSLLSKFGTESLVEQHLGRYQSIDAKQKIYDFRFEQLKQLASDKMTEYEQTPDRQSIEDLTKRVLVLIKARKWNEALELLSSSNYFKEEASTMLLALSIGKHPPKSFVNVLFEKGALLQSSAIMELTKSDDVDLAKYLLSKGLEINYSDPLGNSPLIIAVQSKSLNMLDFLLDSGASSKSNELSFDALDYALKSFRLDDSSKQIVDKLIMHGTPIETSHREWVQSFTPAKLDIYVYLVNKYPSLKS